MNAIMIVGIGTVICNIGLLWMVIKLYTEIMKILKQRPKNRSKNKRLFRI